MSETNVRFITIIDNGISERFERGVVLTIGLGIGVVLALIACLLAS